MSTEDRARELLRLAWDDAARHAKEWQSPGDAVEALLPLFKALSDVVVELAREIDLLNETAERIAAERD